MNALPVALTIAFAAGVDAIEATTIVFAVGLARSWRPALLGSFAALLVLVLLVAVFGAALVRFVPVAALELAVGVVTLLFGLSWLRKAVQRWAGRRAPADQRKRFERAVSRLRANAGDAAAFAAAFGAVLLEGLEVAIVVITFSVSGVGLLVGSLSALAGILLVTACAIVLKGPLTRVPENAMKFVVGTMLTTFGTYWTVQGIGGGWPSGARTIPLLFAWYLLLSLLGVALLRRRPVTPSPSHGS